MTGGRDVWSAPQAGRRLGETLEGKGLSGTNWEVQWVEEGQRPTVETAEASGSFLTPSEAPVCRHVLGAEHWDTNEPRLCSAVAHRVCNPPLLPTHGTRQARAHHPLRKQANCGKSSGKPGRWNSAGSFRRLWAGLRGLHPPTHTPPPKSAPPCLTKGPVLMPDATHTSPILHAQ